jgi:hypothetical protein
MFVYVVENCREWLQATMRPLQWRIGIENGEPSQDLDGVGRGDMSMLIPDGDWDVGRGWTWHYPLVMTNSLLLKMAIEIVDFPMKNGGSFHSYVNVYQRVPLTWQMVFERESDDSLTVNRYSTPGVQLLTFRGKLRLGRDLLTSIEQRNVAIVKSCLEQQVRSAALGDISTNKASTHGDTFGDLSI